MLVGRADRRLTSAEGGFFELGVDFRIAVRAVQADVPQPASDHVYFCSRFQKMDCGGMAKDVGADRKADWFSPGSLESHGMTTNNLIDSEASQSSPRRCCKDGCVIRWTWRAVIKNILQFLGCGRPQGTSTPPVSLSMELNTRVGAKIEMADTGVGRLLNTSAGVIQKQQQSTIAKDVSADRGKAAKQGSYVVTFKEMCFGRRRTFGRNGYNPLAR